MINETSSLRLLLVGDILDAAAPPGLFSNRPVEIRHAPDGRTALALIESYKPDLLLTTEQPGGIAGEQFCREAKRRRAAMPIVVALTAWDETRLEGAMTAGAEGCILSPIDKGELKRIAESFLDTRGRRATRVLVRYRTLRGETTAGFGYSVDLSRNGMRLEAHLPLVVGDRLELQFYLPRTRRKLTLPGTVVREQDDADGRFGAGIEFGEVPCKEAETLSRFLVEMPPAPTPEREAETGR